MPQFQPDQALFGDLPGYGAWDIGHAREHIQFVQVLAQQTPPVLIPDYNLLSFLIAPGQARRSIVESHAQVHLLLRAVLGINNADPAVVVNPVNLDEEGPFYSWLGVHRDEHALIRQALGLI
jgi:hypothetical protein